MTLKKSAIRLLLAAVLFVLSLGLVGCGSVSNAKTPQDAIKDVYGNEQFKISFYADTLETPIADMYYSANDMPTLPIPERVGYVFAGWFFDSALKEPCDVESGDLYWKMRDITLYAAWNKEEIANNGTYDIEFDAQIVDDSIVKGILADKYGWYKFPYDIIENETYIEKNDSGTFLRIQYDCRERGPIFSEGSGGEFEKQTYTLGDGGTGRISRELSVFDRTSRIQTLYYNIDNLDLTQPIILNVSFYNWGANLSLDENREQCSVGYSVRFRITRLFGFTRPFVDTDGKLADGVYLVPTHYTGLDKSAAMLDSFHPVYAYIIAENGQYKLVKQLTAYNSDILGNLNGDDYFNRTTGYARDFAYFLTDTENVLTKKQSEDTTLYVPQLLKAESYGELTYEFHAATGKYYYTFDLGDRLNRDIVLFGGSTGAMEQMFNFPFGYRRLCINYDSVVQITDWDYTPLSGDSYTYRKQTPYYAGYVSNDFSNSNAIYDLLKKYSLAADMVNVFFSSLDDGETGERLFDAKMTISPTEQTVQSGNVSDMRYKISYFDMVYQAFGYQPSAYGELYASTISYLSLSPTCATNFKKEKVDIGKTLQEGETVDLLRLYIEKVYPTVDESNLSWRAYRLDGEGNADFSSPISLARTFTFNESIAISFAAKYDDGVRNCLVTLMPKSLPEYSITEDGWTYDDDGGWTYDDDGGWTYDDDGGCWVNSKRYKLGTYAAVPEITYEWLGRRYSTYSLIKFDGEDRPARTNYLDVAAWDYSNGLYRRVYTDFTDGYDLTNAVEMTASKIRLTFRLINRFGEFEEVTLEYRGEAVGDYSLSENGKTVQSGDLAYTDGKRNPIEYDAVSAYIISKESDVKKNPREFVIAITDSDASYRETIDFRYATVYLKDKTETIYDISRLWGMIENECYAIVYFVYGNDYGDVARTKALYNFTIDATDISEYRFVNGGTDLFTGEELEFERPKIASGDYKQFARGTLSVFMLSGDNYTKAPRDSVTVEESRFGSLVIFKQEGTYLLTWAFDLESDFEGNRIFGAISTDSSSIFVRLGHSVTVHNENCDINVTYVTDKSRPFDVSKLNNGIITEDERYQYYKTTVSMSAINNTPDYYDFDVDGFDSLYGWGTSLDFSDRMFTAGRPIGKLGVALHTLNPTLYALWDSGITVTAYYDMDGKTDRLLGQKTYYRPVHGGNYTLSLFDFRKFYSFPVGYEVVGWRADKAIFYEGYGSNAVYSDTTDAKFEKAWDIDADCKIWLVVRKQLNVSYRAVDENGNSLAFVNSIGMSRDVLEGSTIADSVSETKLEQLKNVACTDSTKEFKYWAVSINGRYERFDIEKDVIKTQFADSGKTIVLYAVFGTKETAV